MHQPCQKTWSIFTRLLRPGLPAAVFCAVLLVAATVGWTCPTCKNALAENDPDHQRMVAGYYYSILFMMSMPFLLLGAFSTYMYVEVRKARAALRRAGESQEADDDALTTAGDAARPTAEP